MNHEEATAILRRYFKTVMASEPGLMIQFDNTPFVKPEGEYWIRFSVLYGESIGAEFGGVNNRVRTRTVGVAVAQIFGPKDVGDQKFLHLSGKILEAFSPRTVDCVTLQVPSVRRVGVTGGEYQLNVNCPFRFDKE